MPIWFALEEASAVVLIISLGLGSLYIFVSPEDNARDIAVTIGFCLLNGGYFSWCFALIYRGKTGENQVSASQSPEESSDTALRVPKNSFTS